MLAMWEYLLPCKGSEKLLRRLTQAIMAWKGQQWPRGYLKVTVTNPNLWDLQVIIVSILNSQQLRIQK